MADGWRPLALGGIVLVVILTPAFRDAEPGEPEEPSITPAAAEQQNEPAPTDPPVASHIAAEGAPVPEVDGSGTRLLSGGDGAMAVALTFDDGPHPKYTEQVLAVLRDRDVVATFCLVGGPARSNPDLVKAIVADGHVLCNHTVDHDMGLRHRSDGEITSDLEDTQAAILAAAPDADIRFFRAPGGNFATNLNSTAATLGFTPLGWSIDTRDWRKPGAAAIRDTVLTQIHPGAVVLMHDGGGDRSQTVSALPEIIDGLAELGYSFVVPAT
jgi:peptidoglycan/xylan/chitin deacetylase (PgdA/CDA1 family)